MEWILIVACVALAFANGANDNLKGVATLYGASLLDYRRALALATATQLAGSLASILLAGALVRAFSGKGLVPPAFFSLEMLAAVALAAAVTVGIATRTGMPISTTHAIVGGLLGAGAVAAGPALELGALGSAFLLPLAVGPLLAVAGAWATLRIGRQAGAALGLSPGDCICVRPAMPVTVGGADASVPTAMRVEVAPDASCALHGEAPTLGVGVDAALKRAHLLSAATVGIARGLNDTPKILGLMVGAEVIAPVHGAALLGAAMAVGGLLAARGVAETLAHRITPMGDGPGFAASLTTAALVTGASRLGLPVSTTHVSAGGIFGIGANEGTVDHRAALGILGAWVGTLPLAASAGAAFAWALGA